MSPVSTASRTTRIVAGSAAAATLAIAGATLFNRAAARRAEERYPPVGQIMNVDGVAVHFVDTGVVEGGETIVLIHGNASLVQDFLVSGIVDRLRSRHRVILFDRPGYGYTDRPDDRDWTAEAQAALLVRACTQLAVVTPVVVVGHSWGTLVALAWALDHPATVSRLVLLAGYYYPSARIDSAMLQVTELPGIKQVFDNAIAPLQTRITGPGGIKMVFSPAKTPDRFMADMPFELMLRPGQISASASDGAQMPANAARLSARYAALHLPISVAWGDGDKLVDHDGQSARLVREIGADAQILRDAGHMIHHIDPQRIADLIDRP